MQGTTIQAWTMAPFAIMLLMLAVAPIISEKFWESNRNKLICTLALSVPTAIYLISAGLGHNLAHQMFGDYIPFIILLLTLFVVTGGIQIKGEIVATPVTNGIILTFGYILASFMGTTGAAMLLVRPLLEINKKRQHKTHTVMFFIAMVANAGGILTPLGDPPLFLLYLRGVPFGWFLNLLPVWAFVGACLLVIYEIFDTIYFRRESTRSIGETKMHYSPIRVKGRTNLLWLVGVILSVVFLNQTYIPAMGAEDAPFYIRYIREFVLLAIIAGSWFTTSKVVRKGNNFTWSPIIEVAILFVGIFVTMTPALLYLSQNAAGLGIDSPDQFYYGTGALSAFLDNSPTAVAFYSMAGGLDFSAIQGAMVAGVPDIIIRAIALGAVLFGSMTYIGNGPNFMVKAIAEKSGVKMPGFFGYMFKFSLIILLPVYILVQLLFL